jgi:hypothetical protein
MLCSGLFDNRYRYFGTNFTGWRRNHAADALALRVDGCRMLLVYRGLRTAEADEAQLRKPFGPGSGQSLTNCDGLVYKADWRSTSASSQSWETYIQDARALLSSLTVPAPPVLTRQQPAFVVNKHPLTQAGSDTNELRTSPIESGVRQFISWRPRTLRETTSARNDYISQDQSIHFCPEETIQGFLRLADHGLILIERCVEYHRYARENAKVFDQLVISWVG